jgi:hypothetical protein
MWAIHQVTGRGTFAGAPIGIGPVIPFYSKQTPLQHAQAVKPGDMIVRREQWDIDRQTKPDDKDPVNHQCLVTAVDVTDPMRPMVTTINGNGPWQAIHVRTERLSHYSGYYNALTP